ncbi:MAG: cytochrome c-type biogenesis protein CcmH [Deltaproteobacteria bacterium]|nr:cytochrome c-type biogenesis protein CcmH [Deltaproteobacteria bacterium]
MIDQNSIRAYCSTLKKGTTVFKKNPLTALFFVLLLVQTLPSHALTPDQEKTAKELETEIIAPCCFTQPVSIHPSGVSDEIKAEIRKMLGLGKSKQAILDEYVKQYGIKILSIPPQSGFNRLAFVMPLALGVLSLVTVLVLLKRWRGHRLQDLASLSQHLNNKTSTTLNNPTNSDDRLSQQLKRELEGF